MKRVIYLIAIIIMILPGLASAQLVRFIVTSDTQGGDGNGVNSAMLGEIAWAAIDEGVDFVLAAGDLVDGTPGQGSFKSQLIHWRDIMQPVYDAGIGVYPIRGNHDYGAKADWNDVFSGSYALPSNGPTGEENITYSFTYENVFVVGLDEYINPHRVNQSWLDGQFALNSLPHVFVFGHEPAFKLFHDDCLDDYPSDRDVFWNSLKTEGARVYFCGHDHSYDHTRIDDHDGNVNNDLHQFIGLGGGEIFYNGRVYDGDNGSWTPMRIYHENLTQGTQGYILVEVDGPNATISWKHRSDPCVFEVGDVFTYSTEADASLIDFYDDNLRATIAIELGVGEPNSDDILGLISLDANDSGADDLGGLEYAANLSELHLNGNGISDIWPLTKLKNLTVLDLGNNPLGRAAYCAYLAMIVDNNPGLNLIVDTDPDPGDDCVVSFADPNLEAEVETEIGIDPNYSEMLDLAFMDNVNNKGISDLTGLEHARNLAWLYIRRNQISDISVLLKMKNLTNLELSINEIVDVWSLSRLKNLSYLKLANNQISNISAISQLNLRELGLVGNPLNTAAYCRYMPMLGSRNPAIDMFYDTNPNPLTSDCSSDWFDVDAFASQWLASDCNEVNIWCGGSDLDHLNDVDFYDFAELGRYWLDD